jgi:hypothetical protein
LAKVSTNFTILMSRILNLRCGSCQQRWPIYYVACFKLIDTLICSFGGLIQTSLMDYQFRVAQLFQHLSMLHLACHANAITAWLIGTMPICFISRCISFTNNVVFKSNAIGWHSKFTPTAPKD